MDDISFLIFDPPIPNQAGSLLNMKTRLACQSKYILGNANKQLVQRVLVHNGICPSHNQFFTISWSATFPNLTIISPLQKINHFPNSKQFLGNKASLANTIQNSEHYHKFRTFFPRTFILPDNRDELFNYMKLNPKMQFISKPPDGSCGNGIKIVTFEDFFLIKRGYVVSEYISRPLCIDGFKFDLRIYVLVTSFVPLRAFVYKEGLARFATESYSNYTKDSFSHLTNATLNKHSQNWTNDFKWKLSEILIEIQHRFNKKESEIMEKILNTVSITLALVQPVMVDSKSRETAVNPYFELYGFDLLLDTNFDLWLLEINTNPSLGYDSDVDFEVKAPLISQVLSIVGIPDSEPELLPRTIEVDDMRAFDLEMVENENDRNELSGNGFIRIFPSARTALLESLLVTPKYGSDKKSRDRNKNRDKEERFDPQKIGKSLSTQQTSSILLRYLARREQKMRNNELSQKEIGKIQKYLLENGLEPERVKNSTRTALHNFIIQKRILLSPKLKEISVKLDKLIESKNDAFLADVIINSPYYSSQSCKSLF